MKQFAHLDFVQEAVFVLNTDREIVFANTLAVERFGPSETGQAFVTVIRNPKCLDLIGEVLDGAQSVSAAVFIRRPSQAPFNVRVSAISEPVTDAPLVLVSLQDADEARQAEEMRSDFVANVSHELRSPLSAIRGFIETLQGPAKDDRVAQERFLSLMEGESDRMARLITDLLSLSEVEVNQRRRPMEEVDLASICKRVQWSLTKQGKQSGKDINLDIADNVVPVPGSEDQLIQVVQNLLENALKYSAPLTSVEVRLGLEKDAAGIRGDALVLTVEDTGDGIPKEHIPRLTERFYRVDSHRSRQDGGTGLGLAIVKHIVQRHRGRLKIDSVIGKGSTFSIYLPTSL